MFHSDLNALSGKCFNINELIIKIKKSIDELKNQ